MPEEAKQRYEKVGKILGNQPFRFISRNRALLSGPFAHAASSDAESFSRPLFHASDLEVENDFLGYHWCCFKMYMKRSNTEEGLVVKRVILVILIWLTLIVALIRRGAGAHRARFAVEESRGVKLQKLLQWARSQGAHVPSSVLLYAGRRTGGGFQTTRAIQSGEVVCSVPRSLFVFADEDEGSPVFNLAKYLLTNRNSSAFVAALPWKDLPRNFSFEFEDDVRKAWDASDESWDKELFRAAVFLVISRLHVVGQDHRLALVPLCDMFNTNELSYNVECSSDDGGFVCRALRPLRRNEELYVRYRTKDGVPVDASGLKKQWRVGDA